MHLVAAGKPQKISFNCSHIFQPNSVGHLKNWDANTKPKCMTFLNFLPLSKLKQLVADAFCLFWFGLCE
jgi:hypothetical protein